MYGRFGGRTGFDSDLAFGVLLDSFYVQVVTKGCIPPRADCLSTLNRRFDFAMRTVRTVCGGGDMLTPNVCRPENRVRSDGLSLSPETLKPWNRKT